MNLGQSFVPLKTNKNDAFPKASYFLHFLVSFHLPLSVEESPSHSSGAGRQALAHLEVLSSPSPLAWACSPLCDTSKAISRSSLATLSAGPLFKPAASLEWKHPGGPRHSGPLGAYSLGKLLIEYLTLLAVYSSHLKDD